MSYNNVVVSCYVVLCVIDRIRRWCVYNGSAPYWQPNNITVSQMCPEGRPVISERVAELGNRVS